MILDLSSFAFGYELESGSGTPNWGTSLGQGKEYKISTNLSVNDILQGMIYKSVPLSNISAKLGKGGKECRGNLADSPIILGAVFDKVYIRMENLFYYLREIPLSHIMVVLESNMG